jgi:hypothetical protein
MNIAAAIFLKTRLAAQIFPGPGHTLPARGAAIFSAVAAITPRNKPRVSPVDCSDAAQPIGDNRRWGEEASGRQARHGEVRAQASRRRQTCRKSNQRPAPI